MRSGEGFGVNRSAVAGNDDHSGGLGSADSNAAFVPFLLGDGTKDALGVAVESGALEDSLGLGSLGEGDEGAKLVSGEASADTVSGNFDGGAGLAVSSVGDADFENEEDDEEESLEGHGRA